MEFGALGGNQSKQVLFTLGLVQYDAIEFLGKSGMHIVPQLWLSYFNTGLDTVSFFYNDYYLQTKEEAIVLDTRIALASLVAGGVDLLAITMLTVRQTLGATQLTNVPERPFLFIKEISSDSDIQTVDVIYPSIPIFLWLNPSMIKYMLEPLYENQESGHYPRRSAIHDLGVYPNARGYPAGDDWPMPLEECGNMIIMTLAYAQYCKGSTVFTNQKNSIVEIFDTFDNSSTRTYLASHYNILKQWADFLVDEALIPAFQLSTDEFAGQLANQTNLALKGIIGLRAMAEIAEMVRGHEDDDAEYFRNISMVYLEKWQDLGIAKEASPPHTTLAYGENKTHGMFCSLFLLYF